MNSSFLLMCKRFFLLIFFLSVSLAKAQTTAPTIYQIPVQGKIVDDADSPIAGAVIQVMAGSKVVATTTTGGDGKYLLQLPHNADYIFSVSGPGMVTKKFMLGARGIPPERAQEPFGAIEATVGLWKKVDGIDYTLLNQPANKYYYNPDKQKFEYDKAYLEQMLGLIQEIREKEKNLEKNKKDADKNYQAAIKKADASFAKKDWTNAKAAYTEASGLKPSENYPKTQIAAIDAAMKADADAKAKADADAKAKADADAKAKAELEAKYNAAIKKGDAAFKTKDWANAKAGYNEALGIKSAEKYPKDQLAAIDKAIADEKNKADADAKAKAELEVKYAAALKKGDEGFAKKDWANAKAGYNEALGLKPAEKYPKDQIALIDKAIADDAATKAKADAEAKAKAELEAKYLAAVKKGDDAFKTKDWNTAKAGYSEALGIKAAEKYPKDQLALVDKALADDAAAKAKADADTKAKAELEAKYAAAIKKGDAAFAKKDWTNAKAGYTEALGLKSAEKYPKDQITAIDKAIADDAAAKAKADADAKAKAELEAKYNAALKKGDEAFAKKDWTNARVGYNEALGIKANEQYPKDKLLAIDKAIADEKSKMDAAAKAKAEAELKAKYDAVIKKGDAAFAKKDWVNAKAGYNEALGIKPEEKYPKDQLAAINKAMGDADAAAKAKAEADAKAKAEAELNAKYAAALKIGDDNFKKKDWANARTGYNSALGIKPNEKYPKDQLAAIDKAIADEKNNMDAAAKAKAEAELNAKYAAALKIGDDNFKKKDWANARTGYNGALGIKPNEKYPKDQLAAIDKAIEDEKNNMDAAAKAKAEAELNAKYAAALKIGDDNFKKKDWANARTGYNGALGIKPNEKYPKDQLAAIDKAIADEKNNMDAAAKAKAEAELNAKYAAAIKRGDDAFKKKDWATAKGGYNDALGLKPGEKYPTDQLAAIDKAIADAKIKNPPVDGSDVPYKAAMVRGDNEMKFKKYKDAVGAYTEALTYKPGDPTAKAKLAEAQKNLSADDNSQAVKKEPHPLSLKYPQGVTEESKSEPGVYIVRRILVKGDEAWVYTMKKFNWGGVVFYKDDAVITQTTWDNETR